jgi:hypothetical protein
LIQINFYPNPNGPGMVKVVGYFPVTSRSTIHDFILIGEGNLALTMFGNAYLLSIIMLLALNNMVQLITIWLRIC